MNIPFLDLKAQYQSIKEDVHAAINQVIDSCAFAGGVFVDTFEKEFAKFCNCRHAVAVGNGTEALWLALLSAGVGSGDEVLTVPNTFIATAEAISLCSATPVFVDVEPLYYTMDSTKLEQAITPRTKAIIPVHLFGQVADMDPIMKIAKSYGLKVIEDASQAHGAEYRGKLAGSIGHAGCFSFYPGKNLGAYGEAGAVVTNCDQTAAKMRMFRDHGQSRKYHHQIIGWNARMDGIQGAILSVKLKHLPCWTESRRVNAGTYSDLLACIPNIIIPVEANYRKHVYHIYAIRTKNRDQLMNSLGEQGVHCMIHYPVPLHLQDAYKHLGFDIGSFPISEQCAQEYLSLPMYAELTVEQMKYVATTIKRFVS